MEKDEQNICPVCLEEMIEILTECDKCHNFIHKICEKMCNRKCPICRTVHEEWEKNEEIWRDITPEWDEIENINYIGYPPIPQFGQEYSYTINTTGDFHIRPVFTVELPSISNTTSGFIENNYTTLAEQNIGVTHNTNISHGVTSLNYLTVTNPLNDYFLRQTRNNTWFNMVPIMDNTTNAAIGPSRSSWFLGIQRGNDRNSSSETSQETIEKKDRKKQMKKLEKKSQKMERRNRGRRR